MTKSLKTCHYLPFLMSSGILFSQNLKAMVDSSSLSSRLVYFVVVPLILLSGIVVILNQKPSNDYLLQRTRERQVPTPSGNVATVADYTLENEESRTSGRISKNYSNLEIVEATLTRARASIQESERRNETLIDPDYVPSGPSYKNATTFHRSYLEMEKLFKIYIYEDGEPPLFHYSESQGILGIEGILIHQMEISRFRTRDPEKAHVYFIPISVQSIAHFAYVRHNREWTPLQNIAKDYMNLIAAKYPYWNRTLGHDHFMLACHDWAPTISNAIPHLFKNSIRVLCNANTSEQFKPAIDVSMPEIYLPQGTMDGLLGGPPPSERSILVFYAGGIHGYIRQQLMDQWKNKDPDVQIHEYLPKDMSYYDMFRKSKYCICPSGWEVASPRMVEGLYMGCVPVLLKDHYVKPFDDVLDWNTFSVDVGVDEIGDLKKILMSIPQDKYVEMQKIGIQVRKHFEVNFPPKRYDVFHMILHSIWLRRLDNILRDRVES